MPYLPHNVLVLHRSLDHSSASDGFLASASSAQPAWQAMHGGVGSSAKTTAVEQALDETLLTTLRLGGTKHNLKP